MNRLIFSERWSEILGHEQFSISNHYCLPILGQCCCATRKQLKALLPTILCPRDKKRRSNVPYFALSLIHTPALALHYRSLSFALPYPCLDLERLAPLALPCACCSLPCLVLYYLALQCLALEDKFKGKGNAFCVGL